MTTLDRLKLSANICLGTLDSFTNIKSKPKYVSFFTTQLVSCYVWMDVTSPRLAPYLVAGVSPHLRLLPCQGRAVAPVSSRHSLYRCPENAVKEPVFLVAVFELMQNGDFYVLRNGVCDILARKTASPQRHSYRSMPMAAECELLQS